MMTRETILTKFLPIYLAMLLAACGTSMASAAPLQFVEQRAGISHTLLVDNLKKDAKGVPSFDYTYTQQSGSCKYVLSGKAVAGHEEVDGKLELEIYNPQGPGGEQAPSIMTFYAGEDNFTLPVKDVLKPRSVTYQKLLNAAARAKSCDKKADRIEIVFTKPAR